MRAAIRALLAAGHEVVDQYPEPAAPAPDGSRGQPRATCRSRPAVRRRRPRYADRRPKPVSMRAASCRPLDVEPTAARDARRGVSNGRRARRRPGRGACGSGACAAPRLGEGAKADPRGETRRARGRTRGAYRSDPRAGPDPCRCRRRRRTTRSRRPRQPAPGSAATSGIAAGRGAPPARTSVSYRPFTAAHTKEQAPSWTSENGKPIEVLRACGAPSSRVSGKTVRPFPVGRYRPAGTPSARDAQCPGRPLPATPPLARTSGRYRRIRSWSGPHNPCRPFSSRPQAGCGGAPGSSSCR